jgi:hypothetical protein
MTDAGTVAAALLLFKATGVPPGAAMPLSVTVPVDEFPPFTEVGLRLNDRSAAGEIVSLAVGAALFRVAVIVAVVCALTPVVVTANVAVVCPAGTVTDAGTVAAATLLLVVTTVPVAPAGPLRVTVPVEPLPPNTDDGLKVSEARVAGVTVRFAFKEVPANVAVIVTGVEALTPEVLTVNVAVVCPAGTVIELGTVAAVTLLASKMAVPPVAAGPLRVTVPVELLPPWTLVGLTLTEVRDTAEIVRVAFCEIPLAEAVITADVWVFTPEVVTENVAVGFPEATVTEVGAVAAALLLPSVTTTPLGPAWPLSVTVPVELLPPATKLGLRLRDVSDAGLTVRPAFAEAPLKDAVTVA